MPLVVLVAVALSALHVSDARAESWRWPLEHRSVSRHFSFDPARPFERGARRGIAIAGPRGAVVRAPCGGRVTFAGPLPPGGRGVTVRCGALAATTLGLAALDVRRGQVVAPGSRLGTLGGSALRLGARRAGLPRGYLDPLTLLRDPDAGPVLAPAARRDRVPRSRRPGADPASWHVPAPHVPSVSPLLLLVIWGGLGLLGTGLTIGITLRARRRRPAALPRAVTIGAREPPRGPGS